MQREEHDKNRAGGSDGRGGGEERMAEEAEAAGVTTRSHVKRETRLKSSRVFINTMLECGTKEDSLATPAREACIMRPLTDFMYRIPVYSEHHRDLTDHSSRVRGFNLFKLSQNQPEMPPFLNTL